jgi:hypothetical protein
MDLEKLINQIMKECAEDGEPVTREEAEEMAKMEINAKKDRRYELSEKAETKKKKPKARKVDTEKLEILKTVAAALKNDGFSCEIEKEIAVHFGNYSLKLIRHRPPKK